MHKQRDTHHVCTHKTDNGVQILSTPQFAVSSILTTIVYVSMDNWEKKKATMIQHKHFSLFASEQ